MRYDFYLGFECINPCLDVYFLFLFLVDRMRLHAFYFRRFFWDNIKKWIKYSYRILRLKVFQTETLWWCRISRVFLSVIQTGFSFLDWRGINGKASNSFHSLCFYYRNIEVIHSAVQWNIAAVYRRSIFCFYFMDLQTSLDGRISSIYLFCLSLYCLKACCEGYYLLTYYSFIVYGLIKYSPLCVSDSRKEILNIRLEPGRRAKIVQYAMWQ